MHPSDPDFDPNLPCNNHDYEPDYTRYCPRCEEPMADDEDVCEPCRDEMEDTMKIVEEYWAEPGKVRYHYRDQRDGGLWNVSAITDRVWLWCINANGGTHHRQESALDFIEHYTEYEAPSLYDQMVAGRK